MTSLPDVVVIATIPVPKGKPIPFVEELRNGVHSVVFEVRMWIFTSFQNMMYNMYPPRLLLLGYTISVTISHNKFILDSHFSNKNEIHIQLPIYFMSCSL